jgi:hypothetical protein
MASTETVAAIAPIVHEAVRAYQQSLGEVPNPPWPIAPEWLRASLRDGIEAVLDGSAGTPAQQHEHWMTHRLAAGWVHGTVKNVDTRTHPSLVPYAELPEEEQRKDVLFRAVVLALTAPIGADDAAPQRR